MARKHKLNDIGNYGEKIPLINNFNYLADEIDNVEVYLKQYVDLRHPPTYSADMIIENPNKRFVSDMEKETWNNKVDKVSGKGLSTEDYTTAEKNKLAEIEEGANKYIHPSTHPASMIIESTSRRFVSDTEKSTWNNNKITIGKTQPDSGWWFEEID